MAQRTSWISRLKAKIATFEENLSKEVEIARGRRDSAYTMVIKPSYESAKVWAKKFSDLLNAGDASDVGYSSYWAMVKDLWIELKRSMGE